MKKLYVFSVGVGVVLVGGFLWALRGAPMVSLSDDNRLQVAATIFPLYDIVKNVAGADADVLLILPPGAEPHSFDPSPSLVRDLQETDVVFAIGEGLDSWIGPITDGSNTTLVMASQGITLSAVTDSITDSPEDHESEGPTDPHYWLTIPNAIVITQTVATKLASADPAHAESYYERRDAYVSQLKAVDADIRKLLSTISQNNIVTFHDAWYYFAKEYGLTIVGSFEPTAGREPTPKYLSLLAKAIEQSSTTTLYTEPLFSDAAIVSFSDDQGLTLAELDDIGGVGSRNSYIALMRTNAQTIHDHQ
jgi:ABC-type Zn uptake system ZnuABC Zn-binding protein ZnuA